MVHRDSAEGEDKKLQNAARKLQMRPIEDVSEANFFLSDGDVLHFTKPELEMTPTLQGRTLIVSGEPQKKGLQELIPGILKQLGESNLSTIKKQMMEQLGRQAAEASASAAPSGIPEVESFD